MLVEVVPILVFAALHAMTLYSTAATGVGSEPVFTRALMAAAIAHQQFHMVALVLSRTAAPWRQQQHPVCHYGRIYAASSIRKLEWPVSLVMTKHQFGGTWTEDKLTRLKKYLVVNRTILKKYPYFTTWYVDAFAGNGERAFATRPVQPSIFFEVYTDAETAEYFDGSAKIALGLQEPFDRYLFIDKLPSRLAELEQSVLSDFAQLQPRCTLLPGDANVLLKSWCRDRDWKKERAVVFLDPYGMQVEWETVQLLAATKAVDLWYLFPLGIGALRLLTRTGEMEEGWKKRLDALLGTPEWRTRFYESSTGLFEDIETKQRTATAEQVRDFLQERLRLLFPGVAEGLMLTNSPTARYTYSASRPPQFAQHRRPLRLRSRS